MIIDDIHLFRVNLVRATFILEGKFQSNYIYTTFL